jgi:Mg2+-importing ATPase
LRSSPTAIKQSIEGINRVIESRASWPPRRDLDHHRTDRASHTVSPLDGSPEPYWIFLAAMLLGYGTITQLVKSWSVRRLGE